jgi:hypothetical protein
MRAPRVYIPQVPTRRARSGEREQVFDLSPAVIYGELTPLVSPHCKPFNPSSYLPEMRAVLQHAQPEDCLLPVGEDIIRMTAAIVMHEFVGSPMRMLKWHGKDERYELIEVDFWHAFNDAS